MISALSSVIFSSLLFQSLYFTHAQEDAQTVQDDWIAPAGPDNSTTVDVDQQYGIQWTDHLFAWFPSYAPAADVSNVDLWITGYFQHQFAHLVSSRVNINDTQELFWGVNVLADELAATPYWVFRFLPSGETFNETSESISSPGFVIRNLTAAAITTSSIASTIPTSSDVSSIAAATVAAIASGTSSPQTTSTPTSTPPHSGLSIGAKAGIAVGAAVGAIILIGIGYYLARRRKTAAAKRPAPPAYTSGSPGKDYPEVAIVQKQGNYQSPQGSYHNQNVPHQNTQYQNVPYGHGPFSQSVQVPAAEMEHRSGRRTLGPAELS